MASLSSQSAIVSLQPAATSSMSTLSSISTNSPHLARKHLPASDLSGIIIATLLLFSFFLILFYFIWKRRRLRLRSLNISQPNIEPFPFSRIMNLRREGGRRKIQRGEYEAGNDQARALNEKASPDIRNTIPERIGPNEPPNLPVASQTLHRRPSFVSEAQETNVSVALTERQQELRERAESMRGGISALEAALLNENIPEEQRRDAQAELQQLRSTMACFSWMEQSDWARGLVDEPPPAYNTLLGR
jgi:hypothetical protein